jgi:hypothetical protein
LPQRTAAEVINELIAAIGHRLIRSRKSDDAERPGLSILSGR